MNQENKELLLRDLCARLPYGVYGNYLNSDGSLSDDKLLSRVKISYHDLICADGRDGMILNGFLKPYLFPLSDMVKEVVIVEGNRHIAINIDWLNANHIDYRGLIEKGLAIDATGLNIY